VELTPLSNQTIWRVMITLDDLPEKEPLKGSMTIVTGDPDPRYSKFEVPVTVYPPLTTQVTTARTLTTRPSLDVQTSPNRAVSQPVRVPPAASVSQPVKVPAQTTPPGPPPRPDTK
jgi:multidrug efflux pump subunit AcrA (membrane-fusion protein)